MYVSNLQSEIESPFRIFKFYSFNLEKKKMSKAGGRKAETDQGRSKDSVNDTRRSCLPEYPCGPTTPRSRKKITRN